MIKRPLMMVERIMYVDPETPLNCIYTARIKGEIPEENFKTALIRIQQKHPILRTNIDHNKGRYPFFMGQRDIEPIPLRIVERKTDEDWFKESENISSQNRYTYQTGNLHS